MISFANVTTVCLELQLDRPQGLPGCGEIDPNHHLARQSDHAISTRQSYDSLFLDGT